TPKMASCDGNEFETNRHSLTVFSSCNRASAAHTETPNTKFQTPGKLQYSNLQTQAPAFSSFALFEDSLGFGVWDVVLAVRRYSPCSFACCGNGETFSAQSRG